MIHGLSKHSQKGASAAVDYVLDANYYDNEALEWKPRDPAPVILEGDPVAMKQLCNSLDYKNKYTSGVLSFSLAESEKIRANPGMKDAIIDEFKAFLFAGIDADDCKPLLLVEHAHLGRIELHYQVPRMHLESCKYWNPFPPNYGGARGIGANKTYKAQNDAFTDYVCDKYGLQNPRDPAVARDIQIYKFDPNKATKEEINKRVGYMIERGAIKSRDDIVSFLEKAGGKITRKGDDYLSVKFDDKKAIRLKGPLYGKESFGEIRQRFESAGAGRAVTTGEIEKRYSETLSRRAEEVKKRHGRSGKIDRESEAAFEARAEELFAIKAGLHNYERLSRTTSEFLVESPDLLKIDNHSDGILNGIGETNAIEPILTGNPALDSLLRKFHQALKKAADEEIKRVKNSAAIGAKLASDIRVQVESTVKFFLGLFTGNDFLLRRRGTMDLDTMRTHRQMLCDQQASISEELAVAQARHEKAVEKYKDRTQPLQKLVTPDDIVKVSATEKTQKAPANRRNHEYGDTQGLD